MMYEYEYKTLRDRIPVYTIFCSASTSKYLLEYDPASLFLSVILYCPRPATSSAWTRQIIPSGVLSQLICNRMREFEAVSPRPLFLLK